MDGSGLGPAAAGGNAGVLRAAWRRMRHRVDGHPVVADQIGEAAGITLSDGAHLPLAVALVDLDRDHHGLAGQTVHHIIEQRRARGVEHVRHRWRELTEAARRVVERDDRADRDDVGRDTHSRDVQASVPQLHARTGRLVEEYEIGVAAHRACLGDQQCRHVSWRGHLDRYDDLGPRQRGVLAFGE
ncbi:hypothetical protein MP11Mi_13980 [Gordonia sp. MP11Mi]|uniref:Uncharacterized protein n=1 Tax=Gordonia sp. MP11Mi TaxID=3022769 RepID=A0AA97GW47_9ACTN